MLVRVPVKDYYEENSMNTDICHGNISQSNYDDSKKNAEPPVSNVIPLSLIPHQ